MAERFTAALSHRTWTIDGNERCHLFLLLAGCAALTGPQQPMIEMTAPTMVWLPHGARGKLQVMAGGAGISAVIGLNFVQRTIADAALGAHLRLLLDQTALAGPDALASQAGTLAGSFATLVEESQELRPAAAAMMGLQLGTLLLLLWRSTGMPAGSLRGTGATTAQRFRQLVELHYRDGLRIDQFAARLGVTRAHLHDACLRAAGRTPLALLHDRLLAEARSRLEQTDLSVEQVGYGIGFRDPGYFNRFFKRSVGQPPGAYRRSAAAARPTSAAASFAAWP